MSARAAISALASGVVPPPKDVAQVKTTRANASRPLLLTSRKKTILIKKPAPIDVLPVELRLKIISYLDQEPYTLLNILLLSRIWYLTLMHGPHAEQAWKRRCELFGAENESPNCNWHQTFIQLLHDNCISCFRRGTIDIGRYLLHGFTFIKACRSCWDEPGDIYMVKTRKALKHQQLHKADLEKCPTGYYIRETLMQRRQYEEHYASSGRCHGRQAQPPPAYILNIAVNQLSLKLEDGRLHAIQVMADAGLDEAAYFEALLHSQECQAPKYKVLEEKITEVKKAKRPTQAHFAAVIEAYKTVKSLVREIEEAFAKSALEEDRKVPCHSHLTEIAGSCLLWSVCWLDALLDGNKTVDDYVFHTLLKRTRQRELEEDPEKRRQQQREEERQERLVMERRLLWHWGTGTWR